MRSKFIKGRPVYIYKGRMYMEQPEKTIITKIVYDENNNSSKVYCKRPTILIELLSLIVMIFCIFINVQTGWGTDIVSIKYNSSAVYYDGKLYLNITVDKSPSNVKCTILKENDIVYEMLLSEGDIITCVEVPYSLKYKLMISTENILGSNISEVYDVSSKFKEY